jgi:hypothetical protein
MISLNIPELGREIGISSDNTYFYCNHNSKTFQDFSLLYRVGNTENNFEEIGDFGSKDSEIEHMFG